MKYNMEELDLPVLETKQGNRVPVGIISLRESTLRREALERQEGIPRDWVVGFMPAIDMRFRGADIDLTLGNQEILRRRYRKRLRPSEVGCALSHRRLAAHLLDSRSDLMLVLEDDIRVQDTHYMRELEEAIDTFHPYARSGAAFVVHLGPQNFDLKDVRSRKVSAGGALSRPYYLLVGNEGYLTGAHAYLISRSAAARSDSMEKQVIGLADDWGHRLSLGIIDQLFFCWPALIHQNKDLRTTQVGRSINYDDDNSGVVSRLHRGIQSQGLVAFFSELMSRLPRRLAYYVLQYVPYNMPKPR